MDYRAELDPGSPLRTAGRAQRVRVQLELAIRELDSAIAGLSQELEGVQREIEVARVQRETLAKLEGLDPAVFDHLIALLRLDAPEDDYDEHLAEALRDA